MTVFSVDLVCKEELNLVLYSRQNEINMVMQIERGQNTHGKGEQVKIPLLPNNVDKRSANDRDEDLPLHKLGCKHVFNHT